MKRLTSHFFGIVSSFLLIASCAEEEPEPGIIFPELPYGSVLDIDGNTYKTIEIGQQTWMAENLKTTRYNDNTAIPHVVENTEWQSIKSPAYCWYNNDASTKHIYGALYNYYTVQTDKLCPSGWHIPSDEEWKILEIYLGMSRSTDDSIGARGTNEGGKLKETGTVHWNNPNTGATNESGFTALPVGHRYVNGPFNPLGSYTLFWSSTDYISSFGWTRTIVSEKAYIFRKNDPPEMGLSVRCLKD